MTMDAYKPSVTRALKWLQNKAPNVQLIVTQKSSWYEQFNSQFWSNWQKNVYDLRTASPFGLMVWSIILGVPSQIFGLFGSARAWAYGPDRQNYVYSGADPLLPNPNLKGGNFSGAGNTTVVNIQEVRWALMLRYVALVCNGRVSFINYMLRYIFNKNEPWDFANNKYMYLMDCTGATADSPTAQYLMEYRIGSGMNFSPQFINLLNLAQYGIMPSVAGTRFVVILEP